MIDRVVIQMVRRSAAMKVAALLWVAALFIPIYEMFFSPFGFSLEARSVLVYAACALTLQFSLIVRLTSAREFLEEARCGSCAYDLSGLPAGADCPECGKPGSPAKFTCTKCGQAVDPPGDPTINTDLIIIACGSLGIVAAAIFTTGAIFLTEPWSILATALFVCALFANMLALQCAYSEYRERLEQKWGLC